MDEYTVHKKKVRGSEWSGIAASVVNRHTLFPVSSGVPTVVLQCWSLVLVFGTEAPADCWAVGCVLCTRQKGVSGQTVGTRSQGGRCDRPAGVKTRRFLQPHGDGSVHKTRGNRRPAWDGTCRFRTSTCRLAHQEKQKMQRDSPKDEKDETERRQTKGTDQEQETTESAVAIRHTTYSVSVEDLATWLPNPRPSGDKLPKSATTFFR